ncbi:archaetidylserine decarboxylase [Paraglaciecola hydrolytica]|uniref:phosphatidylserine decarboxylase n=1 Tax=Paraglaciecola hydrolytica TaxID=1799789 RepID=A0A135ZYN3_9ALTE|nr:archaetidylserine decarboxylase [Paraglaciecola hydrolytica]KXI28085.1 phosphatidylserine decarboxylase [Paraglaciecola hydrolytica]
MKTAVHTLTKTEQFNFLLTNRIPRRWLTLFMGWFSQIESPLLAKISIAIWQCFAEDLRLQDAKKQKFTSLGECFTRELKDGLRPIDQRIDIVSSPCDAIVGACGRVEGSKVFQAKGFPYELSELIPDVRIAHKYRNGVFVTLRLKSSMYHRFHAPVDCQVKQVNYISGDTWNVNPIALKRVEKLFCKNERAVIELKLDRPNSSITLVPVAAILVASMKFNFLSQTLNLSYRGANVIPCDAQFSKGAEMGYFQHGSTIIVFASHEYQLCPGITPGQPIKMGEALLSAEPESNDSHTSPAYAGA